MIYECETCEAALAPGLIACPRCGQVFDEPVPDDAASLFREEALPPTHSWRQTGIIAILVAVFGVLTWFGYRHWPAPPAVTPFVMVLPARPTDLGAHPQYAANMVVFVQKLRLMGVGAQWPACRSNDVLLITPQVRVPEASTAWTADMYRRLAQGIYGQFAQNRYESGFSDTDTTACFVIVTSASGQVMAVDFMGNLQ